MQPSLGLFDLPRQFLVPPALLLLVQEGEGQSSSVELLLFNPVVILNFPFEELEQLLVVPLHDLVYFLLEFTQLCL